MLLPLLSAYFNFIKINANQTLFTMIASFGFSSVSFIYGTVSTKEGVAQYLLNMEPFFPGLILSVILYTGFLLINSIRNKKKVS